jgi:heme A synthase
MMTLDDSLLALGSCIAGIGILMTGLLALLFRHPDAPRWTRPEIVAMLLCVPVTATIGFGLGYTTYGLYQLAHGAGDPRGLLVLAAVLIVLALVWRGLRIRQRLKDYAVTSNSAASGSPAMESTLAIGEEPPARGPAAGLAGTLA